MTTAAQKLLLNAAVPKPMDGAVLTTGLVAGQTLEVTAALKDRAVAELQKIQVGVLVAILMRHDVILQSGSHFAVMKSRSATMMPKRASTLREVVFLHSLDAQLIISRATVTETTTSWATETDTETITTDGTTTVKTASTTITDTETKTEWTTKYSTSTTTHKQTVTVFVQGQSTVTVGPTGTAASSSESGSGDGGNPKGTIIGAAVGGGLGLILITLLAFFLWRRRRKSANQTQQPGQFYAANSEAPATAQKPPPFMATTPTPMPAGVRDTWASSPSRSEYSQPPAYPSPMPELANTQFAYEMHTSPQRSPQELYHPQYMSGLGLPEMRDQRRG